MKDYDNLDFLLNIYFDYIYNKVPERNYAFEPFTRKNIRMIDLKKPNTFDWSEIFNASFKYLGYYNDRLHFKRKSNSSYPCELSIGFYENENTSNMNTGVLYNVAMMYMISEIISNEKFKHSILPVMLFDIDYSTLIKNIPDLEKYIKDEKIKYNKTAYCLITEHFYEMMTLREYIEKNNKKMSEREWKVLFFQILYSLYKITERFTQFRHNMLNLDSILVYTRDIDKMNTSTFYKVGDTKFNIPNVGFDIKFTDYDKSSTNDYIANSAYNKIKYNDYYDVHYFISYLSLWLKENSIDIPKSISIFIKNIVPEKNNVSLSQFNGIDESIDENKNIESSKSIPSMILKKNIFFDEFIIKNKIMMDSYSDNTMSASSIDQPTVNINKLSYKNNVSSISDYTGSSNESILHSLTSSPSNDPS